MPGAERLLRELPRHRVSGHRSPGGPVGKHARAGVVAAAVPDHGHRVAPRRPHGQGPTTRAWPGEALSGEWPPLPFCWYRLWP